MKMKYFITGIVALVLIVGLVANFMGIYPISMNLHQKVFQENNYAISGYDAVEYHANQQAVKGDEKFSNSWNDAVWLFSTEENLKAFSENPQKYAPEVGGYCAFAVSKGFTAPGNPEYWHIEDDKLYLFSNEDVLKDALKNFDAIATAANGNWE